MKRRRLHLHISLTNPCSRFSRTVSFAQYPSAKHDRHQAVFAGHGHFLPRVVPGARGWARARGGRCPTHVRAQVHRAGGR